MYLFISAQLFARRYNSRASERNKMSQSGLFIAFSNDATYSTVMWHVGVCLMDEMSHFMVGCQRHCVDTET